MQTHQTTNFPKRNNNNIHCGCDELRAQLRTNDMNRDRYTHFACGHKLFTFIGILHAVKFTFFRLPPLSAAAAAAASTYFRSMCCRFFCNLIQILRSRKVDAQMARLANHCRCDVGQLSVSLRQFDGSGQPASQPPAHKSHRVSFFSH